MDKKSIWFGALLFLAMVGLISMSGKHLSAFLGPIAASGDIGRWSVIVIQVVLLGIVATKALQSGTTKLVDPTMVISLVLVALVIVMLYGFMPELFPQAFSLIMP